MTNHKVVIVSEKNNLSYKYKICGLYLIEQLIYSLKKAGFNKIYIKLNDEEKNFFDTKILKKIKKRNINVEYLSEKETLNNCIIIPSNTFIQSHYFENMEKYFIKDNNNIVPEYNDQIFKINDKNDIKRAEKLLSQYIIENTGGFIAQKINKRISIPISKQLSKTGIHPNLLTIFNMIIGFLSAYFTTIGTYFYIVLGAFLFQLASVFDGVDGEVAKFTFKVSKIGGWLDTIGDNGTLILYLISLSYLYIKNAGSEAALFVLLFLFIGLLMFIGSIVYYLKKYSESGSLVAYDREFLQKLPSNDPIVWVAKNMKYITKKEFFALFFFIVSFTGKIYYLIPLITLVVCIGALDLIIINVKYLPKYNSIKK